MDWVRGGLWFGIVVTLAVAPPAVGQEAQFAGEATVNVIEVPVRVIDARTGLPVRGLKAKDFRILENGKRQKITNFAEIDRAPLLAPGATAVSTTSAPNKLHEMVYFFDLYLMRKGDRDQALQALREHYRQQVAPDEEVTLVVFDGQLRTVLDRSSSRGEIFAGLDTVAEIRARGREQELSFSEDITNGPVTGTRDRYFYERRHRSREYVDELERRVGRVGGALSATMARYARVDARKVLVVFSPGQPQTRWAPSYSTVDFVNDVAVYPTRGLWEELAREAADLGFTLYAIDTSGVKISPTSDVSVATSGPESASPDERSQLGREGLQGFASGASEGYAFDPDAVPENIGPWMERVRKDLLISVAEDTGGRAYFAHAAPAVADVAESLDHHYSLAYVAKHSGDGKTHEIEVTLPKHPDVELHHRRAYIDRPAEERAAQRLRSAMLFGGDANPLGIRIEVGDTDSRLHLGAAGSKRVRVPIDIKIPIGRIEMVPQGDIHWGKVAVTFLSEDGSGNQSEPVSFEQPIAVPSDQILQARAKGFFKYSLTVDVEGGEQKIYIGVEDLLNGRTSIVPYFTRQ